MLRSIKWLKRNFRLRMCRFISFFSEHCRDMKVQHSGSNLNWIFLTNTRLYLFIQKYIGEQFITVWSTMKYVALLRIHCYRKRKQFIEKKVFSLLCANLFCNITNIFYYGAVHWLTNFTDNNVFQRSLRREAIKELKLTYNTSSQRAFSRTFFLHLKVRCKTGNVLSLNRSPYVCKFWHSNEHYPRITNSLFLYSSFTMSWLKFF